MFIALAIGCVLGALPYFPTMLGDLSYFPRLDSQSLLSIFVGWVFMGLMIPVIPGFLVAFLVAGNVHTADMKIVVVANGIFYTALSYFLMARRDRRC